MNWDQLRAILWLRWRLSRNQFLRGGTLNAVLSVVVGVLLVLGACGTALGGVAGGWAAGAKASPPVLLVILDGVVFGLLIFWGTGLMVEIQRAESIDLPKLLHLPITLRQVFVFNYVVSHFSPGMLFFLPGLMGFCLGLALGGGVMLALMIPAAAGFVFMLTAWSYCLRGWLAALMTNKRRRRSIIVWVTVVFVLFAQLPNLLVQSSLFKKATGQNRPARTEQPQQAGLVIPEVLLRGHLAVPLGWPGYSAMTLKAGNPWPAVGASLVGGLVGVLGLMRAYRMTLRFYQGYESGRAPVSSRPVAPRPTAGQAPTFLERRLPGLPDEVAALGLATFRSLVRSPELKMAFIMPVVMAVILVSTRFSLAKAPALGKWSLLLATAAVGMATLSVAPTMGNAFGLDRNGFRALVLLPTRRHYVLLAKNLAFFPFMALISLIMLALGVAVAGVSVNGLLMGLIQAPTAFLLLCLFCNYSAILAPYKLAVGTLQAKKPKAIVFLVMFINLLLLPLVAPILLLPPGAQLLATYLEWPPWLPVGPLAAAAVLPLVAWAYWLILPAQGRLLQRREQTILLEVTEDTE